MPMIKLPLTIEHALLGFVRQQPMYGYEIYQQLLASRELGLVWNIKQSMLYALLTRLEQEDYLSSTLEAQDKRPARKMLHITEQGIHAFDHWVSSPVKHGRDFRMEFLAKLYFANQTGSSQAQHLIEQQQAASNARLHELNRQASELSDHHSYDWLVLRFRITQLEAIMEWLEECRDWLKGSGVDVQKV